MSEQARRQPPEDDGGADGRVTRRRVLQGAASGLLLVGGGSLLAACGSSSSSSSATSSAGSSTGSTSSAGSTASASTTAGNGTIAGGDGAQLKSILDLPTGKAAGQGLTIALGGDYALSGPASSYGLEQYHGVLMGIPHVVAAGGPQFDLTALNTIDAPSGTANVRRFGAAGTTLVITSQAGGFAAAIPFYPQYKIFAMDCGGATNIFAGKPNFYQGSPERNNAFMAIALKWLSAKMPQAKHLVFADEEAGALTTDLEAGTKKQVAAWGGTIDFVLAPAATSDFTSMLAQIKQKNPDVIISNIVSGSDMGLFMKSYQTSGNTAPVIGLDYTVGAAKLAGPAFGKNFYFSAQYFTPKTQWGELFATAFQKKFGYAPNYYNANYYQAVFWYWDLVRRVIAAGKDPAAQRSADNYIAALESKPTFPSVYGTGGAVGTASFDVPTHTLDHQLMIFGKGGSANDPTILATADVDGSNFKLVS